MKTAFVLVAFFSPAISLFLAWLFVPRHWHRVIWFALIAIVLVECIVISDSPDSRLPVGGLVLMAQLASLAVSLVLGLALRIVWRTLRERRGHTSGRPQYLNYTLQNAIIAAAIGPLIPLAIVWFGLGLVDSWDSQS